MKPTRMGIRLTFAWIGLSLGLCAHATLREATPAYVDQDPDEIEVADEIPLGKTCAMLLAKPLVMQVRDWQFQKSIVSTQISFSRVDRPSEKSLKTLKKLESEGAHAEIVMMKRRLRFAGFSNATDEKEIQKEELASAAQAWADFPSAQQGFCASRGNRKSRLLGRG